MQTSYYRPYTPSDFKEVSNLKLRQADINEIRASCGMTPREVLLLSLITHNPDKDLLFVVIHEGSIEGVFGVLESGLVWFLATDKFKEFSFKFAKGSLAFIKNISKYFPCLYNHVSVEHLESIKWLQWLGFTIDFNNPVTRLSGDKFYYFHKSR